MRKSLSVIPLYASMTWPETILTFIDMKLKLTYYTRGCQQAVMCG